MRGFFVTGTDTGVGKTQVAVALLEVLRERGHEPFALKPYESGGTSDSAALWRAAGGWQPKASVCLYRYTLPLAPAMAGHPLPLGRGAGERGSHTSGDPRAVVRVLRKYAQHPVVVEGAGGLHVPLTPHHDVIDLLAMLDLPVVVAARAGLGTINHTTLTLNALEARGLPVAGVVLSRGVRGNDAAVPLNRAELERRFPRVTFVGPVPFRPHAHPRAEAFRTAARELLAQFGQPT